MRRFITSMTVPAVVCCLFFCAACKEGSGGKKEEAGTKENAEPQKSENELAVEAEQTARTFFEACAKEDWEGAESVAPGYFEEPEDAERLKARYGGLEVLELGKAFKKPKRKYPGFFVPYRIKFKDGDVNEHNIAVRNDFPGNKWRVDGGI